MGTLNITDMERCVSAHEECHRYGEKQKRSIGKIVETLGLPVQFCRFLERRDAPESSATWITETFTQGRQEIS